MNQYTYLTDFISSKVTKLPTDIYGLKYRPSIEPQFSDDEDACSWGIPISPGPSRHFSDVDHAALTYAYNKLISPPKLIVEIGVDYAPRQEDSSTPTLLKLKPKDCMYIGIDVNDKSHLNNPENNVYTIQVDSANYEVLYNMMEQFGHETIDFMFVDGWHSVNQVIKEWKYWEKMIPNGVMVFHDTNFHPGPVALLDAIDTDIFSVELFGRGTADWGVGVVHRKSNQ